MYIDDTSAVSRRAPCGRGGIGMSLVSLVLEGKHEGKWCMNRDAISVDGCCNALVVSYVGVQ